MFHWLCLCYIFRWYANLQTWTSSTFFTSGSLQHPVPCWDPVDALSAIGHNLQISIFVNRIQLSCPPGTKTPAKWGNWAWGDIDPKKLTNMGFIIMCMYVYIYIYVTNIYKDVFILLFVDFLPVPETSWEQKVANTDPDRFCGTSWPHRWRKRHPPREERRAWRSGVSAQNDEKLFKLTHWLVVSTPLKNISNWDDYS